MKTNNGSNYNTTVVDLSRYLFYIQVEATIDLDSDKEREPVIMKPEWYSFDGQNIVLDLNFKNPYYVSPFEKQDKLIVIFKDYEYFTTTRNN